MLRIFLFARAVAQHWGVLVTSGVVIGGLSIWQGTSHPVRPWVFWVVATAGLFFAFFRAWNDQANIAETATAKLKELEWPAGRPQLAFHAWGQIQPQFMAPRPSNVPAPVFQYGFTLSNDGGAALDVTVERFQIDDSNAAYSETVARIAPDAQGFSPILLENVIGFLRYNLDLVLRKVREHNIDKKELAWDQPLVIPLSVIYRDFNNVWYRTRSELHFTHRPGYIDTDLIKFTAPRQEQVPHAANPK